MISFSNLLLAFLPRLLSAMGFPEGTSCPLSLSSEDGNSCLCIWSAKAGTTSKTMQSIVDKFVEDSAKNVVSPIESTLGADNLSSDLYVRDILRMIDGKPPKATAEDASMWFVRHSIDDPEAWKQFVSEYFSAMKGQTNYVEAAAAVKYPEGVSVFMNAMVPGGAFCLWRLPREYTAADFQKTVDSLILGSKNTPIWKADSKFSLGASALHTDFYMQDSIAYANSA